MQTLEGAGGLVSGGRLRAAINLGNAALAVRDPATGALSGVTVAIAQELAVRLGAELEFVPYSGAGQVTGSAPDDAWDIAFLAIDPGRTSVVSYTPPYVLIETTAAVRDGSALLTVEEIDRPGVRLLVAEGSAYDLHLSKAARHVELIRAASPPASFERFFAGEADAVGGVRQSLEQACAGKAGYRILPGAFTQVRQAMAVPVRHAAAIPALSAFVEALKRDGFIREALDAAGREDLPVAPPAVLD